MRSPAATRRSDRVEASPASPPPPAHIPPAAILVLLAGSPLMAMMFAALGPALPLLAAHYGGGQGGAFAAQMIMTVPALGVIAGGLVAGIMVDRFGPAPVLFTGLAMYGAAGSAGLVIDALPALLVARLLLGLAIAHVSTAIGVIVGAWYVGLARARFLGFQAGVAGVASLTFLLLSGVLAERVGWRAPFAIYLLAFVVLVVALLALRGASLPQRRGDTGGRAADLIALWPIYGLALLLFVGYFMTSIQLSLLLAEDRVNSAVQRSFVIASGVLAGGLFGASYGAVLSRLGGRLTPCLIIGLLGAGLLLIGWSPTLAVTVVGAIVSGGAGGMIAPHIETRILARAPLALRARAISAMFTILYAADFLNPLLVTPIRAVFGIHGAFVVVGGALLAGGVVLLVFGRLAPHSTIDAAPHLT